MKQSNLYGNCAIIRVKPLDENLSWIKPEHGKIIHTEDGNLSLLLENVIIRLTHLDVTPTPPSSLFLLMKFTRHVDVAGGSRANSPPHSVASIKNRFFESNPCSSGHLVEGS